MNRQGAELSKIRTIKINILVANIITNVETYYAV
jgi:hypothetical protein